VKLPELREKLRLLPTEPGGDERPEGNVDGLITPGGGAPVNWVPSQQDERPQ
jgi:hypothetical protein